jgi:hypothetical protein
MPNDVQGWIHLELQEGGQGLPTTTPRLPEADPDRYSLILEGVRFDLRQSAALLEEY